MRSVAMVWLSALCFGAAFAADSVPASPPETGVTLSLKPGESAFVPGFDLHVRFDRVVSDSRCPRGTQCIWAGDAVARIWLQRGTGKGAAHDLHSHDGAPVGDPPVRLLRLEPAPAGPVPADRPDPVLTVLTVRIGGSD